MSKFQFIILICLNLMESIAYEIVCVADGDITKNNITNDNWSKRFFDGFNSSIRNYLKSITLSDLISYYEEEIFAGDYSI